VPDGWVSRDICPVSGKLAGPECADHRVESFAPGSEPGDPCPYHVRVAIDARNGLLAGPRCPSDFVVTRPALNLPAEYDDWARQQRLELAPRTQSPLCPGPRRPERYQVAMAEPKNRVHFLYDPETPAEFSRIRLSARVEPPTEPIVFIVDGAPVAKVDFPYELRWPLSPGTHTISAAMDRRPFTSAPITVVVDD
jgi:penicillin-binding protein 1C